MFELTQEKYIQNISDKLESLPEKPGVYLHKNEKGDILYVGKAVVLKNRVRSYFQSPKNHAPKVRALVANIATFDYIITDSEIEALTLESNLIKQFRPRYNILLKDDRTFPFVRIDKRQKYPKVEIVHESKEDGAQYFGPYLSRFAVREAMEAVRNNFPIRTCKKDIDAMIARGERPCLNYHINKCIGPCSGKVSVEEYRAEVDEVINFLRGETEKVVSKLRIDMARAADNLEYERAALLRDRIRSVEIMGEKQKAITPSNDERDVFAFAKRGNDIVIYAVFVRSGRIIGTESYDMLASDESASEIMSYFMKQFYSSASPPREILASDMPDEAEKLSLWLKTKEKLGRKVVILEPQIGNKKNLVMLAQNNAEEYLEKREVNKRREWERGEGALRDLTISLGLDELPERLECYDISHTMGSEPVASMVVFVNGKPAKKEYRRFKIRSSTNDDYAAMNEVLTRRFKRAMTENHEGKESSWTKLPQLVVVDGGKGQVSTALEALEDVGVVVGVDLDLIGLAERNEEVFLPNQSEPIIIETGTPALHLLQRLRDEAHRFAISFHRSLRQKNTLYSILDDIPGVGPRRKKALFEEFVSLDEIKKADIDKLRAAKGMDIVSAKAVYDFFHKTDEDIDIDKNQKAL